MSYQPIYTESELQTIALREAVVGSRREELERIQREKPLAVCAINNAHSGLLNALQELNAALDKRPARAA